MKFEMPSPLAERDPRTAWPDRERAMLERAARLGREPALGGALERACVAMTKRLFDAREA